MNQCTIIISTNLGVEYKSEREGQWVVDTIPEDVAIYDITVADTLEINHTSDTDDDDSDADSEEASD